MKKPTISASINQTTTKRKYSPVLALHTSTSKMMKTSHWTILVLMIKCYRCVGVRRMPNRSHRLYLNRCRRKVRRIIFTSQVWDHHWTAEWNIALHGDKQWRMLSYDIFRKEYNYRKEPPFKWVPRRRKSKQSTMISLLINHSHRSSYNKSIRFSTWTKTKVM